MLRPRALVRAAAAMSRSVIAAGSRYRVAIRSDDLTARAIVRTHAPPPAPEPSMTKGRRITPYALGGRAGGSMGDWVPWVGPSTDSATGMG